MKLPIFFAHSYEIGNPHPHTATTLYWGSRTPTGVKLQQAAESPRWGFSPSSTATPGSQRCCPTQRGTERWKIKLQEGHSMQGTLLAHKRAQESRKKMQTERPKIYFFHSRLLCSAGIPHTLHNTLKESTQARCSKTSASVLHRSLPTA